MSFSIPGYAEPINKEQYARSLGEAAQVHGGGVSKSGIGSAYSDTNVNSPAKGIRNAASFGQGLAQYNPNTTTGSGLSGSIQYWPYNNGCPSCGYCSHCGRGGHRPWVPYYNCDGQVYL